MITPPFGINMFYLQGVAPPSGHQGYVQGGHAVCYYFSWLLASL